MKLNELNEPISLLSLKFLAPPKNIKEETAKMKIIKKENNKISREFFITSMNWSVMFFREGTPSNI